MPVENERKYVLSPSFEGDALEGWVRVDIQQAYLDDGPRIRKFGAHYLFTYKKWAPHVKELVEIETAISQDDFDLLWPMHVQAIQKTRYIKNTDDGEWVVDFLRDPDGEVYFVMAEVELSRFKAVPDHIPDEISDHIVFAVEAEDNRFTNKKLSNRDYAANMLAKVS
jgi:hypothetical protein